MSVTSPTAPLGSPLRRTWPATLAGGLLTLAALPGVANATTFVPLNPQATYLHT